MSNSTKVRTWQFITLRFQLLSTFAFFLIALIYLWFSLSARMTLWADDEYHTIYLAEKNMFSGTTDSRTFGGARFILRLLTPITLYFMNSRMGGEHFVTGWEYPGLLYVQSRLQPNGAGLEFDPNLQDFVFFQRFFFLALAIAGLAFLFYSLWKALNLVSASVFLMSLFSIKGFFIEFDYAYINILQISALAILFGILVQQKLMNFKHLLSLSTALGLIASTKLDGLAIGFVGLLLVTYLCWGSRKKLLALFFGFGISIIVFNFSELVHPNSFLHYTMANVYHYKTGHLITEPAGGYQIISLLKVLQIPSLILLASLTLWIFSGKTRNITKYTLNLLMFAVFTSLLLIFSLMELRFFLTRNALIIGFFLSISSAILVGEFSKAVRVTARTSTMFSTLATLGLLLISPPVNLNEEFLKSSLTQCKSIGLIGSPTLDLAGLSFVQVESIPDSYNFSLEKDSFIQKVAPFDCVLAKWSDNDKSYTNYILPSLLKLEYRFGNVFFFRANES